MLERFVAETEALLGTDLRRLIAAPKRRQWFAACRSACIGSASPVIVSTYGDGDRPDAAHPFWAELNRADAPRFDQR